MFGFCACKTSATYTQKTKHGLGYPSPRGRLLQDSGRAEEEGPGGGRTTNKTRKLKLFAESQKSITTIDGQDCHNATETIKYKKILLSVCPCIEVFPELADDRTECPALMGRSSLGIYEDEGRLNEDPKLELGNAECKHRITR